MSKEDSEKKLIEEGFKPVAHGSLKGKSVTIYEKENGIPNHLAANFVHESSKSVLNVRERLIESRKAAAEIVANCEAAAVAKLEEALPLPMEERMKRRLEIIKDMTQEEINACFVANKISIGELAEGLGIPEVIYPTVLLTPENLEPIHKDIGGGDIDLSPLSFGNMTPTEGSAVLTIRRGRRRENDNPTAYDWDRATPEPVKFLGIFKEYTPGVYTSNSGLVAKEEPEEGVNNWTKWVIRDQDGKELARASYLFDLSREGNKVGEFYSYQHRTGRRGDTHMDMKFGLAHFPQGTVFQVRDDMKTKAYSEEMKPYEDMDTFTVDKVSFNGPGSILISCVEQRPGLIHKEVMEPFMYNVSCVKKIISRGKGKVVVDPETPVGSQTFEEWLAYNDREVRGLIENEKTPYPKLRRGETLFFSPSSVAGILTAPGVKFDETMNAGKYVSDEKWNKFLVSTNCVRYIHLNKVGAWSFGFYAVNVKKFSRWLKKNAHRVFHNLHECQKQDAEADHRFSSEMM